MQKLIFYLIKKIRNQIKLTEIYEIHKQSSEIVRIK